MKLFYIVIALIGFQAFGKSKAFTKLINSFDGKTPGITLDHAHEQVGENGVYFLDTREVGEYNVSHIRNAIHVGYDHFKLSSVKKIPKDARIIVYCSVGARSQKIGEKLLKAGYTDVQNMYGGLFNWSNYDFEMVNNQSKPTKRIHGYSKDWGKWITRGTIVYK